MSFFPILDLSEFFSTVSEEVKEDLNSKLPARKASALNRLRELLPGNFDLSYIENAVVPSLVTSIYQGERVSLPMLDEEKFNKEDALPYYLWGLLYENWQPTKEEDGLSVFIQGYENRGADNLRKKIYYSALTPDLYRPMYGEKVVNFFDRLLDQNNTGKPLMGQYLDNYFDLYWDLHLGVKGDAVPPEVREIGQSFNTVLAYLLPNQKIVYDNYMKVRNLRNFLKEWIYEKVTEVEQGNVADSKKTFVYYWIRNGEQGDNFRRKDVVFECLHNFVALSQWGNTIYNIMFKLSKDTGEPEIRTWFEKTMKSDYDQPNGSPFTPLDRFVMELFRTISPNTGSISAIQETREPRYDRYGYIVSPHKTTSEDRRHWENPREFNPDRYKDAPTSDQIDKARSKEIGFARCPFHKETFKVKDGRKAELTNSAFGTVYGITDDKSYPVCDYAGYAPFGFGYRRCPGELFTVEVLKDFLRKVWNAKIEFEQLDLSNPEKLPIGPGTVIDDNIGFTRKSTRT